MAGVAGWAALMSALGDDADQVSAGFDGCCVVRDDAVSQHLRSRTDLSPGDG